MKKSILILSASLMLTMNSCGTLWGGGRSCREKPAQGHRGIRVGVVVCDLVFFTPLGLAIDIVDGSIYKPCKK